MIKVFDNVKKVVVNKIEKPLDKDNKPFVYNGTTYVPLRFVADALGEAVEWDGKTGTVFIGETNNKNADYWGQNINHMNKGEKVSKYASNGSKLIKDNIGNSYSNYLVIEAGAYTVGVREQEVNFVEFPLNGQYKKFTAILAIPEKNMSVQGARPIKIYLDGKEVFSKTIAAGDMPSNIELDITGASKIRFEIDIRTASSANTKDVGFFNGEFIK